MSRSFRSSKQDANKALAQLDHLEQRGREARTIESYREIARKVAADRLGGKIIEDLGPKDFGDFYVRLRATGLSPGSIKRPHSVLGGTFQQATKSGRANRKVVRLNTPPSVLRLSRTTPTPTVAAALLHETLVAIHRSIDQILGDHRERRETLVAMLHTRLDRTATRSPISPPNRPDSHRSHRTAVPEPSSASPHECLAPATFDSTTYAAGTDQTQQA